MITEGKITLPNGQTKESEPMNIKPVLSLNDFQQAAVEMDKALGEAYNAAMRLKGMWDTFESIPEKQQALYDQTIRVMIGLNKPSTDAHNVYMKLKRYK